MGKNGGCDIKRIRNPLTGVVTNDPHEIVEIFTENYRGKTCDPLNQTSEPSFVFPDVLQDLLQEFNVSIHDIFPTLPADDSTFSTFEIKEVLQKMKNKVATG